MGFVLQCVTLHSSTVHVGIAMVFTFPHVRKISMYVKTKHDIYHMDISANKTLLELT